jgi:hypothetical protein
MCAERPEGLGGTSRRRSARKPRLLRRQADDAPGFWPYHIADVSYALPPQIITTGRSPSQLGADDPGNGGFT